MNVFNLLCSLGIINKQKAVFYALNHIFGSEKGKVLNQVVDAVASGTHTVLPLANPSVMSITNLVNDMKGLGS